MIFFLKHKPARPWRVGLLRFSAWAGCRSAGFGPRDPWPTRCKRGEGGARVLNCTTQSPVLGRVLGTEHGVRVPVCRVARPTGAENLGSRRLTCSGSQRLCPRASLAALSTANPRLSVSKSKECTDKSQPHNTENKARQHKTKP